MPPALPSLGSSRHDQSTGPVELPKSVQTMGSLDATRLNDCRTVVTQVAVQTTLPAFKPLQAALVTANLPLAAVEKQEAGRIEPTAEAKSTFTENSGATQSSDALPATNIPVSEANTLGAPHENTSLASPAAISETQLKKAAPKRISLKDYRSRKSQPLLPLSPCKLELVASVLKKEEKDNDRSSQDGATDPNKPAHESQIPKPLGLMLRHSHPMQSLIKFFKIATRRLVRRLSGANTAPHNSDQQQQAKLSPQTCDNSAAAGAYEDDIDGVAIESMSTPSEGEPDDEERPQEVVDNAPQPPHPEMVDDEEKEEACTPKQLQTLDEAQAEPFVKTCRNSQTRPTTSSSLPSKINMKWNLILETGDNKEQQVLKNSKESEPLLNSHKRAGLTG
ncbi:hypothetical protein PCANC_25568 [Puccinia coronata f. sp. avenae]|uniref:Uncharacterized protein n=1 Tax=Puccinia coronata f. sp. avenae TaxID=200324 RepID=A0A2N5TWL2_9BASI|nr:hypothetical protein PCANC_25568 [Puccinia coronata f. sp. avenae]